MAASKAEVQRMIVEETEAGGYPWPVELFDSVVKVESNYRPGLVNPKSGASGLAQVMPVTLKDYNARHTQKISQSDLEADDISSARKQLQVGMWALGQFWKGAYNYLQPRLGTVPVDELVKIADLFYVAGPGATRAKFKTVSTPSYNALLNAYPEWNAHRHVQKVWTYTTEKNPVWNLEAIDEFVNKGGEPIIAGFDGHLGGFVLASLVIAIAWHFLKGKEGQS